MSKQKNSVAVASPSVWAQFFQLGIYKRNQGRITRQVTAVCVALLFAIIGWRMFETAVVDNLFQGARFLLPGLVVLFGCWLAYRLVNITSFADFLIAVEAEMNKVQWPTRQELVRSSIIVIGVIFILAGCLFAFDLIWRQLFWILGVVYQNG